MAFGVIFLHKKLDKTYQLGGLFSQNFFCFVVKTYFMSPTSSPMRFWHPKCVKYANMPSI
jgi:hypothetical protein